jgi:hypothetical protein
VEKRMDKKEKQDVKIENDQEGTKLPERFTLPTNDCENLSIFDMQFYVFREWL